MKAASLNGSLLARKGAARPSGLTFLTGAPESDPIERSKAGVGAVAATGGSTFTEPRSVAPLPKAAPVRDKGAPVAKLTLRLDRERHLRLKLTSAHARRSVQDILTMALDEYLEKVVPEAFNGGCACLSATVSGDTQHVCRAGAAILQEPES